MSRGVARNVLLLVRPSPAFRGVPPMRIDFAGICFSHSPGGYFSENPWMVALSYAIAAIGSYVALDMVERLRSASRRFASLWLMGSATTLGGTIWSMHFVGMLAIRTNIPMSYDPWGTVLSLIIAVVACGGGLLIVRGFRHIGFVRLLCAGSVVGFGVTAMHYTGMAALRLPGTVGYSPGLWSVSVLIAFGAATAALWLSIEVNLVWQRVVAAFVMAGAICGMHYVGMAAAVIHLNPTAVVTVGMATGPLSAAVVIITLNLLILALVFDVAHRRVGAAALREIVVRLTANREIVRRLCIAGELRDDDTGQHMLRLAIMAERLARLIGCDDAFCSLMLGAAQLHDIGKIGVPDSILLKAGLLSKEEWVVMRSHTEIGSRMLGASGEPLLDLASEIALTHHENWDGSGYPRGLRGEHIPLSGRIVAVADVFDALLSKRPYKEPWPLTKVVDLLWHESGRKFEQRIVAVFLGDLTEMVALRLRCDAGEGRMTEVEPKLRVGNRRNPSLPAAAPSRLVSVANLKLVQS